MAIPPNNAVIPHRGAEAFETALRNLGAPISNISTALPNFPSQELIANLSKVGGGNAKETELGLIGGMGFATGKTLNVEEMYRPDPKVGANLAYSEREPAPTQSKIPPDWKSVGLDVKSQGPAPLKR